MATETPPDAPVKRRPGGQPGNRNASRIYTSLGFTARELDQLDAANDLDSTDTIDLLRLEMLRLVSTRDYDARALAALAKALTTAELARHKMTGGDDKRDMMAALDAVLADVARAQEASNAAPR